MKKRYSNFHRARKYHRKFRNALYSEWINGVDRLSKLHDKYENLSTKKDGVIIGIRGRGDTAFLVVKGHFDVLTQAIVDHLKEFPIVGDNPEGYITIDSFLSRMHYSNYNTPLPYSNSKVDDWGKRGNICFG